MLRIYALFFSFFALFSNFLGAQSGQQLANYLGSGSNPRLQLQLSANGPGWGGFTIDYQQLGGVPWSSNSSINWSSWNVIDTDSPSNYYGTITLTSDGNTVEWSSYTAGTEGYYLDGISLSYNPGIVAYQLTVTSIVSPGGGGGGGTGPFPLAPPATPALYPGTNTPIILQVNGDQIVDNNGDVVWLKGLVRPSLEWSVTGQYLSTQDLSNIANWNSGGSIAKSNVIRLDLYQGFWLDSGPATEIGSYKQIINAIVYYATELGMAVILDLHWVVSGQQSPMANSDSITFWQQVATDYASFGTVLFELFNEPYSISTAVWLNGDSTYVGYQQLYDAVRGTGAQNICIIGGLDYAYDLSFVNTSFKVNGTNIVYCSHPYNDRGQSGYTGQGGTFQQNYAGILGNFPLIFTEFGADSASYYPSGYQQIYSSILSFINANNVNYTGFAWWVQDGDPEFPTLIQDWNGTALYGGINVHDDLLQNPPTLFAGNADPFVSFKVKHHRAGRIINFISAKFGQGLFCWDFGDASGECTTTGRISHTYANPGSYVVALRYLKDGVLTHTSRTIKVESAAAPICNFVCPPRNVEGKQRVSCHRKVTNVITWKAPNSGNDCAQPAYYLVYRDQSLTELVARVRNPNNHGNYRVEDTTRSIRRRTYAVVAVAGNGSRSLPVTVVIGH